MRLWRIYIVTSPSGCARTRRATTAFKESTRRANAKAYAKLVANPEKMKELRTGHREGHARRMQDPEYRVARNERMRRERKLAVNSETPPPYIAKLPEYQKKHYAKTESDPAKWERLLTRQRERHAFRMANDSDYVKKREGYRQKHLQKLANRCS